MSHPNPAVGMLKRDFPAPGQKPRVFRKHTLIDGRALSIRCIEINGQIYYSLPRQLVSIARLEEEWFEDVADPGFIISALANSQGKPDIFTFWQRPPDTEPKYHYYIEWESLAVLPVSTYDHWWNKQVKGTTRNMVRKAEKAGLEVRQATFDDDFVRGMTEIFNETPVRQGRRFWHYGKDCETIKRQFSRFLFREDLIGAYYQGELIGFVMLANAGNFGILGQFISKLKHRDKAINNLLMAKTVETCEKRQLPFLIYGSWSESSLGDFKRHSGFKEAKAPRYFVPLTRRGKLALQLGLHRGWTAVIPKELTSRLKTLRSRWYDLYRR